MLDAGKIHQVPLPVTGTVRELYPAIMPAGRGELDKLAVVIVWEDLVHIQACGKEENT